MDDIQPGVNEPNNMVGGNVESVEDSDVVDSADVIIEEDEGEFVENENHVPFKVKKNVFNLFGLFKKKEKRIKFKKKIEKELKSHKKLYSESYGVALVGTEKLIAAGREYICCFEITVHATKTAISRMKKLRKFTSEVDELEDRVKSLRNFFEEKIEKNQSNHHAVNTEELIFMFSEIQQIKDSLENLLEKLSSFKCVMKKRRKVMNGVVIGSTAFSGLCFGGGWVVTVLGTGCVCATLFTSGLSVPVACTMYSLAGVGIVCGVGASSLSMGSVMLMLVCSGVENVSYKFSSRKVKKIKKKVLKIKRGEQKKLWDDIMETMNKMKKDNSSRVVVEESS